MSKYEPLQFYLASLSAEILSKTMTFAEIEKILNAELPPSAHEHRQWWENENEGTHIHARSWFNAGWKVDSVELSAEWVRFKRTKDIPRIIADFESPEDILRTVDQGLDDAINGTIQYRSLEFYKELLASSWFSTTTTSKQFRKKREKKYSILEEALSPQTYQSDWLTESKSSETLQNISSDSSIPVEPPDFLNKDEVCPSAEERTLIPEIQETFSFQTLPEVSEQREIYDIGLSNEFNRSIDKLDAKLRGRILVAFIQLSRKPNVIQGDTVKPLVGERRGLWRYRIGDYRLIYQPDAKNHRVTVLAFASRGSVYE